MFITAIIATAESKRQVSIHCPCPVRSRCASAAWIATVAYMPGHQVGDRDARLLRAAAGQVVALAGDAHEAATCPG